MFDIKLAICIPFANKLPAGVFICCPDTFETYTFGESLHTPVVLLALRPWDSVNLPGQVKFGWRGQYK